MKRIVSILLTIMMLFSAANFAFAQETDENVTKSEVVREEEREISAEEEYAEDLRKDEIIRNSKFANFEEDDDSSSLMATMGVKGTIYLPDGVKANTGDYMYVELLSPAVLEDGKLIEEYGIDGYSTKVTLSKGNKSKSYTATVGEAGDYIVAVKYFTGHGEIMGDWLYYTEDGLTRNPYLADTVKVKSNATTSGINMTLPAAQASITGTIDLSNTTVSSDGNIYVYAANMDFVGSEYEFYCVVPVEKGDKSVDFEVGVPYGNYYLALSSSYFKYCYYTSSGATNNWSAKETFYVDASGKEIEIAPLGKTAADVWKEIDVTVNFKDEADGDMEYYLELVDLAGERYGDAWLVLEDGSDALETTFTLSEEPADEVYLAITPVYNTQGMGWSEDNRNILYYSSGNGFAGDISLATDISAKTSVTVNEGAYVTIKGNYTASGDLPSNAPMFIGAQFEVESFCTYVYVGEGTYEIKVPKRLAGEEFTLFTANDEYNTTQFITMLDGTYTLKSTSTTTAGDVDFGEYVLISGNVNIPFEASENGAVVSIGYDYEIFNGEYYEYVYADAATACIIMPGETSASYEISVPAKVEELSVTAYLKMYESADVTDTAYSWIELDYTTQADLDFRQTATLTGTISLPNGVTFDEDVILEIDVEQYEGYGYTTAVIPAGKTSVDYSVKITKNDYISSICVYVEDNNVLVRESYYDGEGFGAEWYELDWFVTGNMTASGTLSMAETLSVKVNVPDSANFSGTIRMRAYAYDRYTDTSFSSDRIDVTESGEYELLITVPEDDTAEYSVSVNVYDTDSYEGNLMLGYYYYTTAGWIADDDNNSVYVTVDDVIPAVTVPTSVSATVRIDVPDGAYATDGWALNVYLVDNNDNTIASDEYYYDELADSVTALSFPNTLTGSVKVKYLINPYGDSNLEGYKMLYYSQSGPVDNIDDATPVSVSTLKSQGVTIKLSKQKGMYGKVNVDGNYDYITPFERFNIILERVSDGYNYEITANVDENMNFTAPYGSYLPDGEYYVNYRLYSSQTEGTNLLQQEETQMTNSRGERVVVSPGADAEGLNVTFRAGHTVTGTIYLPDDAYMTAYANVQLRFEGGENYYYANVEFLSNENRWGDYMVGIDPEDEGNYVVEVTASENDRNAPPEGGFTNIVFDYSYYRTSDTENTLRYEQAEQIEVDGDISGVDVTLMTSTGVDVTVKMPSSVPGEASVQIYLYDEDGFRITDRYVNFNQWSSQSKTQKLSLLSTEKIRSDKVYLAYIVDSVIDELCHSEIIYVSSDGTLQYLLEDAEPFILGNENAAAEFSIALADEMDVVLESEHPYAYGQVYEYEYTHPTEADYLNVYFSTATSISYNHALNFYDAEGNLVANFHGGDMITIPGNSFDLEFDATGYTSWEYYGFKIIKVEGMMYEAESAHPYTEADLPIEYEYTHPDKDADELEIYFSPATYIGGGATMYVYDSNGEVQYEVYDEVYDYPVTVEGNSFKIVIERTTYEDFEEGAYGFAIEKIEPVYYHSVTFKDYDGTVLETQTVRDGWYAYYEKEDSLMRESDDENYMYVFSGWDKEEELEEVTEDLVVTATYEYVRAYEIVFKNIDGTILEVQRLPKDYYIEYSQESDPVYPYETDENYGFAGWDKDDRIVKGDIVFTAVFKKIFLESNHPYYSYSNERYEYSEEGAMSLKLTFSDNTQTESGYDKIAIYYMEDDVEVLQGEYSGTQLASEVIEVPSDTVIIYLTSDGSLEYYGFSVTDIEAVFDLTGLETDTKVSAIRQGNSTRTTVNVNVSKYVAGILVTAAYDEEGNLMYVSKTEIDKDNLDVQVDFETDELPYEIKTMIWNDIDSINPLIEAEITNSDEFDVRIAAN